MRGRGLALRHSGEVGLCALAIVAGRTWPGVTLAQACLFIIGGAMLASRDLCAREAHKALDQTTP